MLDLAEVEGMFHFSTEKKETDEEKKEKSDRRMESICSYVPEIVIAIAYQVRGIPNAILYVNDKYAKIIENESIDMAISEMRCFLELIKDKNYTLEDKATLIYSYEFKTYRKLSRICKVTNLKSLSRLSNMKALAESFSKGKIGKTKYMEDLQTQIEFFEELLEHYEGISFENFFAYVVRFDLKTKKKRKIKPITRISDLFK